MTRMPVADSCGMALKRGCDMTPRGERIAGSVSRSRPPHWVNEIRPDGGRPEKSMLRSSLILRARRRRGCGWSAAAPLLDVDEEVDPTDLHVDVRTTARHTTDALELRNFESGALTHAVRILGGTAAETGAPIVDAWYENAPEALTIDFERTKDADGTDRSYRFDLNQYALGTTVADGDRTAAAKPDSAFSALFGVSGVNESLAMNRMDGQITGGMPQRVHLLYERPPKQVPTSGNCLGRFDYSASAPTLDLVFRIGLKSDCLTGIVDARIVDLPADGFGRAEIRRDGTSYFETRAPATGPRPRITHLDVTAPVPVGLLKFVNRDIDLSGERLCPRDLAPWPSRFVDGPVCMDLHTFRATPEFENVTIRFMADGLESVELRTNADDGTGEADAEPLGDDSAWDHIDRVLWENMPLLGVRYRGTGQAALYVDGDDKDDGEVNELVQDMSAWLITSLNRGRIQDSIRFDEKKLRLRFYGWALGADVRKYNRDGQALIRSRGSYVHTHDSRTADEPLPFQPSFIAGPKDENSISVKPGETVYLVPNPYDAMLSTVPAGADLNTSTQRGRWAAKHRFSYLWQSDWFFQILHHKIEADPHGFNSP